MAIISLDACSTPQQFMHTHISVCVWCVCTVHARTHTHTDYVLAFPCSTTKQWNCHYKEQAVCGTTLVGNPFTIPAAPSNENVDSETLANCMLSGISKWAKVYIV